MLMRVKVSSIHNNPFRRIEEYPIQRTKVDALKESISQTGFWGTVVARPAGDDFEIAFGHHRIQACAELGLDEIPIIVRELSNEDMLKMMARENMEEWGTSAWVELETIRSAIAAYGRGEIELPPVPKDTGEKSIKYVAVGSLQRPYTRVSVATFLGWTTCRVKGNPSKGLVPNFACETAFDALELIDAGLFKEDDARGMTRVHLSEQLNAIKAVRKAERDRAKEEKAKAKAAREKAEKATDERERTRLEKKADVHDEQAEQHEATADVKARQMATEAAELLRGGEGIAAVRDRARDLKPATPEPKPVIDIDEYADRIARRLEDFVRKDRKSTDNLRGDMTFLVDHLDDTSSVALAGLRRSFTKVIKALEGMRESLTSSEDSHDVGMEDSHGPKAIATAV